MPPRQSIDVAVTSAEPSRLGGAELLRGTPVASFPDVRTSARGTEASMHAPFDGIFPIGFSVLSTGREGPLLREAMRVAIVILAIALFGYCIKVAWDVLGQLEGVRLVDCMRALQVVSVRDAVLCLVGYGVGKELLKAVLGTRRS